MGLFDHFPYTNFHELNLDQILRSLKEIESTMEQFVAINALKYADPIQWDITSQYEKNTIVIDPQTGTAYISVAPVPIGVALNNTDYWTEVFNLGNFIVRAAQNFANTYEANTTTTATVNTPANGWLVWGDVLYRATTNITAGDSYIVGGNIVHFTIEDIIGHLQDLTTTNKTNLVAAINEVVTRINTEIADRIAADTTLQNNINAEATARAAADTTLQNNINAEASARTAADTTLQNNINAEATARAAADSTINNKLRNIKNRRYIIIGDSYERVTNFGSIVSEYLGHGATSYISTNVQKSSDGYIYVASRGGAGFTNTEEGMFTGNGFLDLLTEATGLLTSDERSNIDTILIAGGVNDASVNIGGENISMLPNNMAAFNNYVKTNYPNTSVNIFMLGRVRQLDTYTGRNPLDVRYNIYRYIDLAGGLGWGYITNSEYVCFRSENIISDDNLHPVATFGYPIGRYIVEGLTNGSVDVTWIDNPFSTITAATGFTTPNPLTFSCNLVNGIRTIRFDQTFQVNSTSTATLVFGVPLKIGTQDGFYAISPIEVPLPCICWDDTGNKFEIMNGILRFYGYEVFIVNRGTPTYGNANFIVQSILSQSNLSFQTDTLIS